ncbi:MAG TPA: tRNA (adenosine(37)-N6)-dimethylallyltransferase MiaA [Lachnospiraceae bacterium]|nr:tRNA (adenosine(37)-N6)-dimethylallyltransferase MiaA [Lachnospiraceae bacterium]
MDKLIVLTGPTAVGKTELSIKLANKINGEIISADSIQVYKNLDIGSAKITIEEMQNVKHYLVDVLNPTEDFNIYIFKEMAKKAIKEIQAKGKIPIIVGGTGFYIQSVIYDISFSKEDNSIIREELEQIARIKGNEFLHNELKKIDKVSAEKIHPNNVKRIIRAIEYYKLNNRPISQHNEEESIKEAVFNTKYFVLNDKRELLYDRIDRRVDKMIELGLVDEVKSLMDSGLDSTYNSMQGIGYKEIIEYLDGKCTLDEAINNIKKNTRHFAKRQLTWFRREQNVNWIEKYQYDYDDERILSKMIEVIEND